MNRLWVRLAMAFIAVTVIGVVVVAGLSEVTTDYQFRHYLAQRQAAAQGNFPPRGGMMAGQGMMMAADENFLNQLHSNLIIAALVAAGIGTLLGLAISHTIAAPLKNLSAAARDFAAHHWERRVPIKGTIEFIEVAQAFNAMADELQRAETLRRNLMADIAHELRTPLTVMQGNLRALLDGVYPLELKEVASLYDETRLLSRLVADLRELALADAGQLALKPEPVDINVLLGTATEYFSTVAETQNSTIKLEDCGTLPPVQADPDRIQQVLHNLLANALRHTSGDSIILSGHTQPGFLRVEVTDSGEGIDPKDLPHIFDRFYRADASRSRATGGSGLGLAIARAWVKAMGGEIGVESSAGHGSTFWFTLPLAA
jgi:signal transduction histidine kinase